MTTPQRSIEGPGHEEQPLFFDGLVVSKWGRDVFVDLRAGGYDGINATCAIWEGTVDAMQNVAQWHRWFAEHRELICPVYTTDDLIAARQSNRTGIVLGFQNASPIEQQPEFIDVFKRLGIGIVQLTYNTTNLLGSGCFEPIDHGLTKQGQEVVSELNRAGVVIDLSHVGERTSFDVLSHSSEPVVLSHVFPAALSSHPRNKSTELITAVARSGGLIGLTHFPAFLPRGNASTVADVVEALEWLAEICGSDHIAYGSDLSQGHGAEFYDWITRAGGSGRKLVDYTDVSPLKGLSRLSEAGPNLRKELLERGWSDDERSKVLGMNWLRLLRHVWHEAAAQPTPSAHFDHGESGGDQA